MLLIEQLLTIGKYKGFLMTNENNMIIININRYSSFRENSVINYLPNYNRFYYLIKYFISKRCTTIFRSYSILS